MEHSPRRLLDANDGNAPQSVDFGRYRLHALLGTGGMGSVYRALDTELDELVALKVLRPELTSSPEMVERFRREVKLARRVTHPNVARTFDIGEHHGERFLTMELIEGESLSALLTREGAVSVEHALEVACAIADGLTAAHSAGVVHRDLKPDNVLLDRSGRIVLTDFGIARAYLEPARTLTRGGVTVGTPDYMAPEQLELTSPIDARADLYALGVILYEMLVGDRPWTGDSAFSIAAARLLGPPPDPRLRSRIPDDLAEVVLRCMARRPRDRFDRADEVAVALRAIRARLRHPAVDRARIACASTLPPPTLDAPSSPPSGPGPKVADLCRNAREAARGTAIEDNDRAISLFERALQEDEGDPWVNAGYASALLRRFIVTEGPIDDTGEICEMVERAIAGEPRLPEPLVVRAELAFELGDLESTVVDLRRARALGAHDSDVRQLEGRLLVELGDLVGATAAFGAATELEPRNASARWEEACARALAGDRFALEGALETSAAPMLSSTMGWLTAARLVMWHADGAHAEMLQTLLRGRLFERRELVSSLLSAARTRVLTANAREELAFQANAARDVPRRRTFYHQLEVELGALCDDAEFALDALERIDWSTTCQLAWLERCPLLTTVRRAPRFEAILRHSRARADHLRAAFAEPA